MQRCTILAAILHGHREELIDDPITSVFSFTSVYVGISQGIAEGQSLAIAAGIEVPPPISHL